MAIRFQCRNRDRQLGQLRLGKVAARQVVDVLRTLRDPLHRLRPDERRPLAISIERAFAPRVEHKQPLLALAALPRLARMHMEAIGAAVDLRGARLDELIKEPKPVIHVSAAKVDGLAR
jgi:hypothetical protein